MTNSPMNNEAGKVGAYRVENDEVLGEKIVSADGRRIVQLGRAGGKSAAVVASAMNDAYAHGLAAGAASGEGMEQYRELFLQACTRAAIWPCTCMPVGKCLRCALIEARAALSGKGGA